MNELEEAGWSKTPDKPKDELTNKVFNFFYTRFVFRAIWIIFKDIKKIFNLVDKDHSGEVSRSVSWTGFF